MCVRDSENVTSNNLVAVVFVKVVTERLGQAAVINSGQK